MKYKFIFITFLIVFALVLPAKAKIIKVEVRYGDTLHGFARKYLKDPSVWPEIYELNKKTVKDPDRIYPGQILKIPSELLKDRVGDIKKLIKDVKVKKRETNNWSDGELSERLFPEDGIMTGEKSFARVNFLVGSHLKVYEDSLIYLKPTEKKTAVASLLGGGLNVEEAKIITPAAEIMPEKGANYDVGVDENETTKVSVRKGEVDVKAQGKTVTVIKGFRTRVEKGKVPESPVVLPVEGEEALGFMEQITDVNYNLQVDKDKDFDDPVKDVITKDISNDNIKKGLDKGYYYWRAAVVDKEGFKGEYLKPRQIYVSGRAAGFIELNKFNVINKEKGLMKISGQGKNISRVSINGYPAQLNDDGTFTGNIILEPGQKVITVTSFGKSGVIMRKYRKSGGLWLPAN